VSTDESRLCLTNVNGTRKRSDSKAKGSPTRTRAPRGCPVKLLTRLALRKAVPGFLIISTVTRQQNRRGEVSAAGGLGGCWEAGDAAPRLPRPRPRGAADRRGNTVYA
jgi:hypothetical protein